jgi:hypothetical protein
MGVALGAAADISEYEIVNIVTNGGGILSLHDNETSVLDTPADFDPVVTLTTVADDLDDSAAIADTITFTRDGDEFSGADVDFSDVGTMVQDEGNDDRYTGANAYGTWFEVNGEDAPNVQIAYPSEQVEALVYVLGGEVSSSTSVSGNSASQVNVLPVGIAVLDREVSYDDDNMIVVGGPCANTVAAELLGNPSDCAEGFSEGMGMIQSFDTGDNYAILVAGFSARDTVESSRVLALAATETVPSLEGTSVEVVIAGANDISVRAPVVEEAVEAEEEAE